MNESERSLTAKELAVGLDACAAKALESVAPTEWDENHISMLVIQAIRFVLSSSGIFASGTSGEDAHVCAEAYKATGHLESTHGDIVIAVQYVEQRLTGFGFYEAKAAALDGSFPAFNMRQLRRLSSATPRLAMLLYEREPQPVSNDQYSVPLIHRHMYPRYRSWNKASVRAVGANVASRTADLRWSSDLSESFGHHFVTRYLSGRDLDYSRAPQAALDRWLKVTKRAPPIVIGVALSAEKPTEPSPMLAGYTAIPPDKELAASLSPLRRELSQGT